MIAAAQLNKNRLIKTKDGCLNLCQLIKQSLRVQNHRIIPPHIDLDN
jgi:hypothetical protein